mgnify:CR=1 FL=1
MSKIPNRIEAVGFTVADGVRASGLSRTRIYNEIAAGNIRAVKAGKRTIIIADSLREFVRSLPPAAIGQKRTQDAGAA